MFLSLSFLPLVLAFFIGLWENGAGFFSISIIQLLASMWNTTSGKPRIAFSAFVCSQKVLVSNTPSFKPQILLFYTLCVLPTSCVQLDDSSIGTTYFRGCVCMCVRALVWRLPVARQCPHDLWAVRELRAKAGHGERRYVQRCAPSGKK